jgi:glycosyltransferase involved in cell wall biosynthesis
VPNFSVVLIARNEEKTIPRLIKSLTEFQELGGEILVLDTGSTDGTVETARNLGCKVIEVGTKFLRVIDNADEINEHFIIEGEEPIIKNGDKLFDFASARNYIAEYASNDVIATPDCDEIYTKFDIEKICKAISDGAEQLEYNFVFSHDEYGNEAVKFQHSKFYNRKKLKWVGIVHEVLSGLAKRVFLEESIIKLEHWQNPETNRNGYLRGLALDCFLNQGNDRNSHYFARELLWHGRPRSAIQEFKRHIQMSGWLAERAQSMIFIGDAYGRLNDTNSQAEWYYKAFHTDTSRREALIKLGYLYRSQNNTRACNTITRAALTIPYTPFYGNDMAHYTYVPYELLYWSNGWLGNITEAKYYLDLCLSFKPQDTTYLRDYRYYNHLPKVSFLIPQLGRPEGLQRCLDSIKELNYPLELIDIIVEPGDETVPRKVKKMFEESRGEYIVYASNDCEFTPNSLILAVIDSLKTGKGLVSFDTGVRNNEGYINEHFLLRRDLVPRIGGEVFDTEFFHVGVDDLLWHKCNRLNEAMLSKGFVKHYHYSREGSGAPGELIAPRDEIIDKGWSHFEEDRELLKKKLSEIGD